VEAQRLEQRTNFDIELMEEMGYGQGIENYSSHLRPAPATDLPPGGILEGRLIILDVSHVTVPS
jgi:excinuclease ABC subunit B